MVTIMSRAEWGAKHGNGTTGKFKRNRIIAHTTATPFPDGVKAEVAKVRGSERFHVETRKFDGIAYSWMVGDSGTVYEGRGWGQNGAHTQNGGNTQGYAISFIGDGTKASPSSAAIQAARELIAVGLDRGAVDPAYLVSGHGDWWPKECPGKFVRSIMPQLIGVRGGGVILPPAAASFGQAVLGRGDTGPAVETWQRQLNDTQQAGLTADGDFGPATETATKAFQRKVGLTDDGLVGARSIAAMEAQYKLAAAPVTLDSIVIPSVEPQLYEQAVVTTDNETDVLLGAALARRHAWAHVRVGDPLAVVRHAIVIGAAASKGEFGTTRTVLSGADRAGSADAVLAFAGKVDPATAPRTGDPQAAPANA